MADIDPDTLLEWLTMGSGEERDMQVIALEQLCMLLLMSDNVDRCFESCPPRSFLPALCHIFMDETAPDTILEVTARAITYYLDVSAECSRRIVTVDGAIKALCARLVVVDITTRTSKDLAEQCVKVLELMCTREANAIYEAGGLNCMLTFIREHGTQIHKDTLHSAMSVVARLCSKMEPTDDTLETCMDSLSKLLQHQDSFVADTALKCFACLADRFTRRGVDPAPLAKHGLTEELLKKLVSSALACNLNSSNSLNASMSESRSSSGNVSIIVSVLSMLCRGSALVTHDLLHSSLPNAIETAMQGDERCILDTMRLVDLLLILLFEGRDALPKSVLSTRQGSLSTSGSKATSSCGEKSHRQLIDCIRSKDTDALVEAVISSTFDVNFMDDVGQTLLNWASAFGTLEMVEFLCERGADVNRGQRSSSLHYAACFGRPAVVKVLLSHGANPELRDEDGKTPLDKARERNEEGHKEVVQILQSPGEWMAVTVKPMLNEKTKESLKNENNDNNLAASSGKELVNKANDFEHVVKGDPQMALKYVKHLVPVFSNSYKGSLLHSIKKATLAILKKMIHYIPTSMIEELVTTNVAAQLVEVIAVALNSEEDDDDGRLVAFHCVQNLMSKNPDVFLIHFIRLGVLQRITEMVTNSNVTNDDMIEGDVCKKLTGVFEDVTKIVAGHPYHWHDWSIVRGRDCLYLWSDFCAIELSNGSNGWFRFVLDGKLATMYSSGSPEGGSSSSESRAEFLDKLQRARSAVSSTLTSRPVLTNSSLKKLTVGNWTLKSQSEHELAIINADGQQATILKEDLAGFLFESNRGTKHTFTAETSLGADFAFSWTGKPARKYQSKKDQTKQNLVKVARSLYCQYFKDVDLTPHGSMATLHKISGLLNTHAQQNEVLTEHSRNKIYAALKDLYTLLQEETMLSSYEIQTSDLVTALNNCLNKKFGHVSHCSISNIKEHLQPSEIFKQVFGEVLQDDSVKPFTSPAIILVKKLVTVLESSEKLPVLAYEGLGGATGLQILLRRLRFKLERGSKSMDFIDRSGRCIKMEPLTTVHEVERYLLRTVAKQWFDYDRSTFKFVQCFKGNSEPLVFTYVNDFDKNGIIFWIGTNGKTLSDWTNPAQHGIVHVLSSEGRSLPYGRLEDVISRESQAENCHTNDDKSAWFEIDIGVYVIPTRYTLRHSRGYGSSALRTWLFQASNDGSSWTTLRSHILDKSLNEPSSTASWDIPENSIPDETNGWHRFRIQQNGTNASGQTYYLSVSGFEIYGSVTGALDKMDAINHGESDNIQKRQRRVFRSQILRHMALGGSKDTNEWKQLGEQARAKALLNEKKKAGDKGWINVSWPHNDVDTKSNLENDFNLKVVDISDPDVQAAMFEVDKKEKNKNNKARSHSTIDNALKQVVMSFGKQKSKCVESSKEAGDDEQVFTGDEVCADVCNNSQIDLANLQFLMAVEDLLDSPSSDLVASALAEAASMHVDQLRLATRSFRSTLESSKVRQTPSAQGSCEIQSSPVEVHSLHETFGKTSEEPASEKVLMEAETLENIKEEPELNEDSKELVANDNKSIMKEEQMDQIQTAITSSMSDVLDSMHPGGKKSHSSQFKNPNDFDEELSVVENNILNDNYSVLEPNVISVLNSATDIEYCASENNDCQKQLDTEITVENKQSSDYQQLPNEDFAVTEQLNPIKELKCATQKENDNLSAKDELVSKPVGSAKIILGANMEKFETDHLQSELDNIKSDISTMHNEFEKIESCAEKIETHVEEMSCNLESFQEDTNDLTETLVGVQVENEHIDKPQQELNEANTDITNDRPFVNVLTEPSEIICKPISMLELEAGNSNVDRHGQDIVSIDSVRNISSAVGSGQESIITEDESMESDQLRDSVASSSKKRKNNDGMFSLEEILEVHNLDDNSKESSAVILGKDKSLKDKKHEKKIGDCVVEDGKEDAESIEEMDIDDREDDDDDEDDADDDDDDDEFDDIENESDHHEVYEPMSVQHERHYDHQRRMWDDDLILKCQHNALVPAFDPRPGRTNIQQTQDIEIPESEQEHLKKKKVENNIQLYLKGVPYPGGREVEILMENSQATVFSYVQTLVLHGTTGMNKSDQLRRVWEPTYTIVYKSTVEETSADEMESHPPSKSDVLKWSLLFVKENIGTLQLPKSNLISYLQDHGTQEFLKKWKLTGATKTCRKQRNCNTLIAAYREFAEQKMTEAINKSREYKKKVFQIEQPMHSSLDDIAPIQQVLDVLKAIYKLNEDNAETTMTYDEQLFNITNDEFLSKKLTSKLIQQIQDPLALASGSLPLWCEYLVINYPTLFPFETRQMFFKATAFGCSRSIVWLQNMQDVNLERARGHPTRRLETTEFRIGRLKHERVTVPRGDDLLNTATSLMNFHAERKAVLEIEFQDEEGTGLGPSLEFYALVSLAIQRNNLSMWVSMDEITDKEDISESYKKYSWHQNGLFPAPLPQESHNMDSICDLFTFLGIFLAKCIQDNRLVDIPLSDAFFKMMCAGKGKYARLSRTLSQTSETFSESSVFDEDNDSVIENSSVTISLDSHYFSDVLTEKDFALIHPHKAKFVKHLKTYIDQKDAILSDSNLKENERENKVKSLMFATENGHEFKLEDLGLTFQYMPSSTVYGYDAIDLLPGGSEKLLTADNVEEYIELLIDFTMHKGIARQLEAFRAGFNRVFPMERLHAFKAHEVRLMLCGEQNPEWTYEELLMYTEPKYGYHKDSPGFKRLINVLAEMTGPERKAFLQFSTGCSSLPPGGIAHLHPRLTVVKKDDEGDNSFPSVNTCVHYLKLPEYSSEEVLREKLMAATKEKGFHLN